jgi:hypothetical protein
LADAYGSLQTVVLAHRHGGDAMGNPTAGHVLKVLTGLALAASGTPYAIVLASGGFSRGAAEDGPILLFILTGAWAALLEMALLVALVLGEWRGVVTWRWAVLCLLAIALASLCPALLYPPLLVIVTVGCLLLSGIFLGRKGTRFRSLPSVTAVASSWRLFRQKRDGKRPRYAWRTAQSLVPVLLVGLACLLGYAAAVAGRVSQTVVDVAMSPVTPRLPGPYVDKVVGTAVYAPLVMGCVLGGCAAVCLVLAAMTYPWAQYQYATVLGRFGVGLRSPSRKASVFAVACLMLLDLLLAAAALSPLASFALVLERGYPEGLLVVHLFAWPLLVAFILLFRWHFREVYLFQGGGLGMAVNALWRLITRDLFELVRGMMVQAFYFAGIFAWAFLVAALPAVVGVLALALPLAGIHAFVYWGLGMQGPGHIYAGAVEASLLLFMFMIICGLLASPLFVLAALHRAEYVRAILEGPASSA